MNRNFNIMRWVGLISLYILFALLCTISLYVSSFLDKAIMTGEWQPFSGVIHVLVATLLMGGSFWLVVSVYKRMAKINPKSI